ncbi:MAG TPA: hypothetical protein VII73_13750 [Caulobacteraceae bacterium]
MNDAERLATLENALAQAIRPIKGVPFNVVIRALCGHDVVKMDRESKSDQSLISTLSAVASRVGRETKMRPIKRPRPNEVGNDIEFYILDALKELGINASRPTSAAGLGLGVGYPDILITERHDRHTYLEAKTYSKKSASSAMRSFYLSPSERFKVSRDGRHLLLAFEMERRPIQNSELSEFRAVAYKLVDLRDLICDVKQEFQSDNRRLYINSALLAEGSV